MARYRVLETTFMNGRILKEGDEVDYEGEPGSNLEPIDKLAQTVVAKLAKTPTPALNLAAQVRQHAATRGARPDAEPRAVAAAAHGARPRGIFRLAPR